MSTTRQGFCIAGHQMEVYMWLRGAHEQGGGVFIDVLVGARARVAVCVCVIWNLDVVRGLPIGGGGRPGG
jgi:hypothetical protein